MYVPVFNSDRSRLVPDMDSIKRIPDEEYTATRSCEGLFAVMLRPFMLRVAEVSVSAVANTCKLLSVESVTGNFAHNVFNIY